MKKIILALLLCITPAFSALPDFTSVWEVETGGSDTNGGGFSTGASGTDMSQFANKNATSCTSCQSATVNISTTDAVCAGTTTLTSATANFSAAIVGNFIHLNGGSGSLAAVWKEATAFTNSTTITIDSSCAASTGTTMNIGGALATPGQGSNNMTLATASGVWVKSGTYSISAMISLASGATNNGIAWMTGYNATRGDLALTNCFTATCPVLQAAAGLGGSDNAIMRFSGTPSGTVFSNAILDCNNQTLTMGLQWSAAYETASNIWAKNCSDPAFYIVNQFNLGDRLTSTNSPAAGIAGGHPCACAMAIAGGESINLDNIALLGSTVNGATGLSGATYGYYHNVTIANFTGTTADALTATALQGPTTMENFSIYNITRHAFHFSLAQTVDSRPLYIRNAVISKIGGFCFIQDGNLVLSAQMSLSDHNFCDTTTGSPSGFYSGWPVGVGDVTLTGNPFTLPASGDFSLNSTAGGGASVRAAGFPGVVAAGTGHLDGGALQSAGSGGSSGNVVSGYAQ